MSDESRKVWSDHWDIQKARIEASEKAMREYDANVYFPAMKELRERCERIGHVRGKFHNNGIGWTWFYCHQCGARMEIEGPESQSASEGKL